MIHGTLYEDAYEEGDQDEFCNFIDLANDNEY